MNAITSYPETELRLPPGRDAVARDYHNLAQRIEALDDAGWRGELGGLVSGYSFFVLRRESSVAMDGRRRLAVMARELARAAVHQSLRLGA